MVYRLVRVYVASNSFCGRHTANFIQRPAFRRSVFRWTYSVLARYYPVRFGHKWLSLAQTSPSKITSFNRQPLYKLFHCVAIIFPPNLPLYDGYGVSLLHSLGVVDSRAPLKDTFFGDVRPKCRISSRL